MWNLQNYGMLDYVALGILIFNAVALFAGAIAIRAIPYRTAVERDHPQQDAINRACWVSLFTLHAIWPLLWIWAAAYRGDRARAFSAIRQEPTVDAAEAASDAESDSNIAQLHEDITDSVTLLRHKFEVLDDRIERIEKAILAATEAA